MSGDAQGSARIGAIVLAGGRSSRFGRDKLIEPIDGLPLLDRAVLAVQAVAGDVVVVAAPGTERAVPDGARVVHDPRPFEGPLAGLAAGLDALGPTVDIALVVAGDMPALVPAVLRRLVAALGDGADAAQLADARGTARPLPAAVRRIPASVAARALIESGERRLRALPQRLTVVILEASAWTVDDATAGTLRDVDSVDDL